MTPQTLYFLSLATLLACAPAPAPATPPATATTPTTAPATQPAFSARVEFHPAPANGWNGDAWELAVPQGHYVVQLNAREPARIKDVGDVLIEGQPLLRGATLVERFAPSRSAIVHVTDGRLTIDRIGPAREALGSVHVTPSFPPQRVAALVVVGFSSPVAADRCVGWELKKTGWRGFVETVIRPQLRWGVRRIILSNPFGTLPDQAMQFDQYLHARDARLHWLTQGFAEAWRPITEGGVEVICYLGSIGGDADFDAAPDRAWQERLWGSVEPALAAGMNVALDSCSDEPADSNAHRAALLLEQRGVRVYVEPRPARATPHWHRFPVITVDTFWNRSNPARHPDSAWAARDEQLTGEIIRLITTPPAGQSWDDPAWLTPLVRQILSDGHTAALSVQSLRQRIRLEDILRRD